MRYNAKTGNAQPGGAGEGGRSRKGRPGRRERREKAREAARAGRNPNPDKTKANRRTDAARDAANTGGGGRRGRKGGQHSVPLPLQPNERGTYEKSRFRKTGLFNMHFPNPISTIFFKNYMGQKLHVGIQIVIIRCPTAGRLCSDWGDNPLHYCSRIFPMQGY